MQTTHSVSSVRSYGVAGHQAMFEKMKSQLKQLSPQELKTLRAEINQELEPHQDEILNSDERDLIRSLFC